MINEPLFDGRVYKLGDGGMGLVNVMLTDWKGNFVLPSSEALCTFNPRSWTWFAVLILF